jgi:DMSO/TMAO reductase YedYZ heme-binding membrane subunit
MSWALVTGAVALGLWLSLRLSRKRPRPAWTLDLHRFLGALAVVFTGVHLVGLAADSYVDFGVRELFVPFASTWEPTAVAWGVVALYLLVAIELTSLGMRRLPRKLWRGVHLTSYVLFALATLHMFTAGTDRERWPVQWLGLVGVAAVAFLTTARVLATRDRRPTAVAVKAARATRTAHEIAA